MLRSRVWYDDSRRNQMKRYILVLLVLLIFTAGCQVEVNDEFRFAVLSDVHIQDVEGQFNSQEFTGANLNGANYTIRPMSEQMGSTRLFNENYFAFEQALSELADDGIEYVAITGDITDDGQAMNVEKVASILDQYQTDYGMHFYLVPGNHEPNTVEGGDGGDDFLKDDGSSIDVKSSLSDECSNGESDVICDDQMLSYGQAEMAEVLSDFGYMPREDDQMWITPYSSYGLADYTYDQATQESDVSNRTYQVCNDKEQCTSEYDLTYAVEPVDGYIFLCLDNNVYIPDEDNIAQLQGDNGFNELQANKAQTLSFIESVVTYADQNDKQVMLFSHYPLTDFYAGATEQLKETFGEDGLYFNRLPDESITSELASIGVDLVFSGHMHYNGTGEYKNGDDYLVNVMTSSTAAYVPSYKIVSTTGDGVYNIETKVLEEVEDFDTLFPLYETEYGYEQSLSAEELEELELKEWNKDILDSTNYYQFNKIFLETLVQTRHYPEWSDELKMIFGNLNLYQMVIYAGYDQEINPQQFATEFDSDSQIVDLCSQFDQFLEEKGIERQQLEDIEGIDVVTMFYKFLSARELAYADYDVNQLKALSAAFTYMSQNQVATANSEYTTSIVNIFTAIYDLANDVPSNQFEIDFNNQQITNLSEPEFRVTNEL